MRGNRAFGAVALVIGGWAFALPASAFAGAWTQPEGAFYAKAWSRSLIGAAGDNSLFFADGEARPIGENYSDHALNLYGEYGVTDLWTAMFHGVALGHATVGDKTATYVGPLSFGVRRALSTGDMRIAVEGRYVHTPAVGDESIGAGMVDGRPWYYSPTVAGHGAYGELQLGSGTGFGWWTASVGASYLDSEDVGAALNTGAQIGWNVSDSFQVPLSVALVRPVEEVDQTNGSGAGRTSYLGWNLELNWWFVERVAMVGGLGGAVFASSNASTPSLTFGFAAH